MADSDNDNEPLGDGTHEPRECMACRGSGRVISNLGGTPSTVGCPWCEGSGLRPAEMNAQAHWSTGAEGEAAPAEGEGPEQASTAADEGPGRASAAADEARGQTSAGEGAGQPSSPAGEGAEQAPAPE